MVDMLVGFCRRGNLYSPRYEPVVSRLQARLAEAEARGESVVFLADSHLPDDPEFAMFPSHCVEGSGEDEVVPELRGFADRGTTVTKRTFSGFHETRLDEVLRRLAPRVRFDDNAVGLLDDAHRSLRRSLRSRTSMMTGTPSRPYRARSRFSR